MKCPICGNDTTVIDVRHDCESVGRKRKCKTCEHIFYTMENDCVKSELYALEGRKSKRRVKRK